MDKGEAITRWLSEVEAVTVRLECAKKSRNYYESQRKKEQKHLDALLANDPRQERLL